MLKIIDGRRNNDAVPDLGPSPRFGRRTWAIEAPGITMIDRRYILDADVAAELKQYALEISRYSGKLNDADVHSILNRILAERWLLP